MSNLKGLNTQLQRVMNEAKTLRAEMASKSENGTKEYEGLSDDRTKLAKLVDSAEGLKGQIEIEQKAAELETYAQQQPGQVEYVGSEPAGDTVIEQRKQKDGKLSLKAIFEDGVPGISEKQLGVISTKAYKDAFNQYLRKGIYGMESLGRGEIKTLQEGVDSQGGFLVPEEYLARIIQKLATPTRVAGYVTRLNTSRDALNIPKVNYTTDDLYTTGIRVTWTGEVPASSTAHRVTDPVFGNVRIPVHTSMLSMPITNDMVEDSAFPLVPWATGKFSETIDLLYDNMILNGSGIGQPAGILLNPDGTDQPAVVKSGDANLIKPDGLIALAYAVPEQYDENCRFVFNKTNTGKAIAQLKDGSNRYLFSSGDYGDAGLVNGRPKMLVGYPYAFSGFMPDIAANAFPVIFGDFGGYYLVNRIGFSVQVLRELYAETNQIVLLGRIRFGGQVAEPWKLKIQKIAA